MPHSSKESEKKYWAFISYSSKDKKWGKWLHNRLENYPIPREFQETQLFDGTVLGKNLRPIFRDRDELAGSAQLGPAILKGLKQSRFLIVLCSPNSAKSKWVNKEIEDFIALHPKNHLRILALILNGEPNATSHPRADHARECFPPALRSPLEPLAGDLRKDGDGKERGFIKILAGIAQLDFDELYRRHERAAARRRLVLGTITGLVLAGFALLTTLAVLGRIEADQQREIAESKSYQSNLVAASSLISLKNNTAALEVLAECYSTPTRIGPEWHLLLRSAGPPVIRVGSFTDHPAFKVDADLANSLIAAETKLRASPKADTPYQGLHSETSPDGRLTAIWEPGQVFNGAILLITATTDADSLLALDIDEFSDWAVKKHRIDPRVLASFRTHRYGLISWAAFTADSSTLLIEADSMRGYSLPPIFPFDSPNDPPFPGDSPEDFIFAVPTPMIESKLSAQARKVILDGNVPVKDTFRHKFDRLSPDEQVFAANLWLQKVPIAPSYRGESLPGFRYLADTRRESSGTLGLILLSGQSPAAEIWNLTSQQLLHIVGEGPAGEMPKPREIPDSEEDWIIETGLSTLKRSQVERSNLGGSFSTSGTLVAICSEASGSEDKTSAKIFDFRSGQLVSTVPECKFVRGFPDSSYGFSPDDRVFFQANADLQEELNVLRLFSTRTGAPIPSPDSSARFITWNSDSTIAYLIAREASALEAYTFPEGTRLGSLSDFQEAGVWTEYDRIPSRVYPFSNGDSRLVIGRHVFGKAPLRPITILPEIPEINWGTEPAELPAASSSVPVSPLNTSERILRLWHQGVRRHYGSQ